jgi:hypothetical protein
MASRLKRHENPVSRQDLLDLAELEARATREIINGTIEVPLLSVGLNEAQKAVVDDSLILGSPSRDWWSRQAAALRQRSTNEMRQGIFWGREQGKNLGQRLKQALKGLWQGTRAGIDGQISAGLAYEQWLCGKDEPFQIEVLGRARWELWQRGKLSFEDLVSQNNRPLTIAQLRDTWV